MAEIDGFRNALDAALDAYDRERVALLCGDLVARVQTSAEAIDPASAKAVLGALRRKRHFDLMEQVADAFLQNGLDAPVVRRQYAQALIDQGRSTAAIEILRGLASARADEGETREALGLLGRAYKQMYVHGAPGGGAGQQQRLSTALDWYRRGYEEDRGKGAWHGINLVALLARADRDGVAVPLRLDARRIAADIHDAIARKKVDGENGAVRATSVWDLATAAEACLALELPEEALAWLVRYVQADGIDAFELASTRRQLLEVWQLDRERSPGRELLPVLDAALLRAEGGAIELAGGDVDPDRERAVAAEQGFAKALGKDLFKSFEWYLTGLERARCVAKVLDSEGGGFGTGFLVEAAALAGHLGGGWLLLTNNHVISTRAAEREALRPDQARIRFETAPGEEDFRVAAVLFESPRTELDVTLLALDRPPPAVRPYPIAASVPAAGQRVYVIGHPSGRPLSFSLQDNKVIDHDYLLLHYRAATAGGSSGSPVFAENWDLIGFHRAGGDSMPRLDGSGFYGANEGVSIRAVIAALRSGAKPLPH
jgi:S1-C subfamily serine protease